MNNIYVIATYVIISETMDKLEHKDHVLTRFSDAELLTVAVLAAKYFQNNHERALFALHEMGYFPEPLSISRFNRRLHALADWLFFLIDSLGEIAAVGEVYVIDSMPLPVCKRVRARRCRKVRGLAYCGYCAAKKEKFFGWRLHLICTPEGIPVSFSILPAGFHDLTPIHELAFRLPEGSNLYGDKGYISKSDADTMYADTGVRLVSIRRRNMEPNSWKDDMDLKLYRHTIETRNSQLESMGIQHLHARSNEGFEIKVHASLIALTIQNSVVVYD
jgi:hypothetical protein